MESYELFEHAEQKTGTDYETNSNFKYNTGQRIKTYGNGDKFHVESSHYSDMSGTTSITIELSVDEAKRLKKQIDQLIEQNR